MATFAKEFQTSNIVSNIPFIWMFEHNGVQSILNEEKSSYNKIEPSIFFDEANCGSLHMLYCMILSIYLLIFNLQH